MRGSLVILGVYLYPRVIAVNVSGASGNITPEVNPFQKRKTGTGVLRRVCQDTEAGDTKEREKV